MTRAALQELTGLPLVAEIPFSDNDLNFLNRYIDTRKEKINSEKTLTRLCLFLIALAVVLSIDDNSKIVILLPSSIILLFSIVICRRFALSCQSQQQLLESDLKQNVLLRFEGKVTDAKHFLIRSALLKSDAERIQKIEVLPISGKIHRVNDSLIWTWFSITNQPVR